MRSLSFEIGGEVSGQITITELEDGTLRFDIAQVSDTDVLGDLRAIFFDFEDESLLDGLSIEGADVTDWAFDANSISTLGKDANIKGEIINELGKFDAGVEFGTSGMSKDDIQTTSFILSHDSVALDLNLLGQQDFGLRMTSVGTEEDGRNGSLKLGGTSTAAPDAMADSITTDEDTAADETSAGNSNLLDNDTDADGDLLTITEVNGIAANVGSAIQVAGGASLTVNSDGTFDIDPNGAFESLAVGESTTDSFAYTVSDGNGGMDTATVTITIDGVNDAPTANDDAATTDEDNPTIIPAAALLANDSDPDASDVLSVQSIDSSATAGMVTDNLDGTFTYDPNGQFEALAVGESTTDSFAYTVSDGNGGTDTATVTITIDGVNDAPTANDDVASTDEDNPTAAAIAVLANDTDPDGSDVLTVTDFDTTGTLGMVTNNGNGTFTYDPNGAFESLAVGESTTDSFSYTVSDGNGGMDTATVTITIDGVNDAPTANDDAATTDEDNPTIIPAAALLANDSDPDASDVLSVQSIDSSATAGMVTDNLDGTFTYDPNGQFEALAVGESTTDSFAYTVSDGNGGTDTATVTITIDGVNDAPTANDDVASTDEDNPTAAAIAVLANDTDPDGSDVLTVTDFDTTGTLGMVTNNGNGTFTYDPNGAFESLAVGESTTDSFAYTVSDGNGGMDTATVTITINGVNDAPTANDDVASTDEDNPTAAAIAVLANDTDPDGSDVLTVTDFDTTGTLGMVTNNGNGTFTYDPNGAFESLAVGESTTDSFAYTVSDGNGGMDTATVTITIDGVNDAPTANDDATTTDEDNPTIIPAAALLANDSDPDASDVLTVQSFDTTGTTGLVADNGDGTFTYDPNGAFESLAVGESTTDSFAYTVSDGNGGTDTATVTITINGVNDAPTANDDAATTDEDNPTAAIAVLANDTDPDASDVLTVQSFDTTGTTGLVADNGDGTFTYDPNGAFESLAVGESTTDSFAYTVSDGNGGMDTATVTITINGVNDAPTANDDAETTGQDSSVIIDVLVNDSDPDTSDILDVDSLDTTGTLGVANVRSDGLITYDPAGQFDYLAAGESDSDQFSYTVSDGNGGTDTATVNITVSGVNDAPDAVDDSVTTDEDTPTGITAVALLVNDSDPDASDVLSLESIDSSATTGVVTDNGDGTFTYDPNGQFESLAVGEDANDGFSYTVSDGNGGTDTAAVNITISGVNDDPDAVDDAAVTDEGTQTEITAAALLANDSDPDTSDILTVQSINTNSTTGLVTDNGDGTFTYDPNGAFESLAVGEDATDSFAYTVSDGNGGTDTATVTVTINGVDGNAPIAADDFAVTDEDTAIATIPVLANDTDPDVTDVLTVQSFDTTGTIGLVTNNGDGTFTYDPNGQFESLAVGEEAADSFTYTVSDGNGGTDTATVAITINGVNDAPVADDDSYGVSEDSPLSIGVPGVLGDDTDVDASDVLTVAAFDATSALGATVTVNPNGSFNYDPRNAGTLQALSSGQSVVDTFTYTADDGNGGTDMATVKITVQGRDEGGSSGGGSKTGDIAPDISSGADLNFYANFGDNDEWLQLNGFQLGFAQSVSESSKGGISTSGNATAEDAVVFLGDSAELTALSGSLLSGKELQQEAQIVAVTRGEQPQVVDAYAFRDVLLTGLDASSGSEALGFTFSAFTHKHTDVDAKGGKGTSVEISWDFVTGGAKGPNVDSFDPGKGGEPGDSGEGLIHYVRLGDADWLELENFSFDIGRTATLTGEKTGGAREVGKLVADDVVLSLGSSGVLTQASLDLFDGDVLTEGVEIESYLEDFKGNMLLVDEFNFGNVLLTGLDTDRGGGGVGAGETLSFDYGQFTHGHIDYNFSKGGVPDETSQVGWDLQQDKALSGPAPSADVLKDGVAPDISSGADLNFYANFGDNDEWLQLNGFQLGFAQSVSESSKGGISTSGNATAEDAVVFLGDSAELTALSGSLLSGKELQQEAQIVAVTRGEQPQVVDAYAFRDVLLTGLDASSGSEALGFTFSAFTHKHTDVDAKGGKGTSVEISWDFVTGGAKGPNVDSFDPGKGGEPGDSGEGLIHYVRLGDADWLELENFSFDIGRTATLTGEKTGGAREVGKLVADDVVLSLGSSGVLTQASLDLFDGDVLTEGVEIESYLEDFKGNMLLVDEFNFGNVLLTGLDTDRGGGGETLSFDYGQFTHGHIDYNFSKGGVPDETSQVGWDLQQDKALSGPAPSADVLKDGVAPDISSGADLNFYANFGDNDEWLQLNGFQLGFAQSVSESSKGGISTSGNATAEDAVVFLGDSAELTALSGSLLSGKELQQEAQIVAVTRGEQPQVVDAYAFRDVLLTGLDASSGSEALGFTFSAFTHKHTDVDAKGGKGTSVEISWDFVTGGAKGPNVDSFDPGKGGEPGDSGEGLIHYVRLGDADWLELENFSFDIGRTATLTGEKTGGAREVGKLVADDVVLSLGSSGVLTQASLDLFDGKLLTEGVEIESYEDFKGNMLLVDEFNFGNVLLTGLDTDRGGGGETLSFDYGQFTHGHIDYNFSKGGVPDETSQVGWDLQQDKALSGPAPDPDVFV